MIISQEPDNKCLFYLLDIGAGKVALLTNQPDEPIIWETELRGSNVIMQEENNQNDFQLELNSGTLVIYDSLNSEFYGLSAATGEPVFVYGSDVPKELEIIQYYRSGHYIKTKYKPDGSGNAKEIEE